MPRPGERLRLQAREAAGCAGDDDHLLGLAVCHFAASAQITPPLAHRTCVRAAAGLLRAKARARAARTARHRGCCWRGARRRRAVRPAPRGRRLGIVGALRWARPCAADGGAVGGQFALRRATVTCSANGYGHSAGRVRAVRRIAHGHRHFRDRSRLRRSVAIVAAWVAGRGRQGNFGPRLNAVFVVPRSMILAAMLLAGCSSEPASAPMKPAVMVEAPKPAQQPAQPQRSLGAPRLPSSRARTRTWPSMARVYAWLIPAADLRGPCPSGRRATKC